MLEGRVVVCREGEGGVVVVVVGGVGHREGTMQAGSVMMYSTGDAHLLCMW